jgi:hypothetical protein
MPLSCSSLVERLSAHPGGVEPGDLNVMVRSMSNVVRWRAALILAQQAWATAAGVGTRPLRDSARRPRRFSVDFATRHEIGGRHQFLT